MSKERQSFIDRVNSELNATREDIARKENQLQNEKIESEKKEELEGYEYQKRIEATKKEFLEIGVVGAFEEIIESKFLYISDRPKIEYQPIYNIFGKVKGKKEVSVPNFIPASIHYEQGSIYLKVESWMDDLSISDNSTDYHEVFKCIRVLKKEKDSYEIGCFCYNPYTYSLKEETFNERIMPTLVNRNNILDNLSKLVVAYKQASLIQEKDDRAFYTYLDSEKRLLPHFP